MAHKVLSADMAELIRAMKMAQQYSSTLLDDQYRKAMLKAAHVLAMDSKNLLDAVDNARKEQASAARNNVRNFPEENVISEDSDNKNDTDVPTDSTVCASEY